MITIETIDDNNAKLNIKKGTPHKTMLLGIEMLIESLMNEYSGKMNIEDILDDLRRIYLRDNKEKDNK